MTQTFAPSSIASTLSALIQRSRAGLVPVMTMFILAACDGTTSTDRIRDQGQLPPPSCTEDFEQVPCPDQPARAENIFVSVIDNEGNLLSADIKVRQFMASGESFDGFAVAESDYQVALGDNGRYTVAFEKAIPTRLDLWFEATLSDGTVLRRGLPSSDRNVEISPKTEYAVRDFLAAINGNSTRLNALIPCPTRDDNCQIQDDTILRYWRALFATTEEFDLGLSASLGLEASLAALGQQPVFSNTVDQLVTTIIADKVPNPSSAEDTNQKLLDRAGTYHSASFTMSLGQGMPGTASPSAVFANTLDTIVAVSSTTAEAQLAYPQLTYTPAIVSRITETIPFSRLSNTRRADGQYTLPVDPESQSEINFLARGIPTVLRRDANFELTQLEVQDVVGEQSAAPTGYVSEPYSALLYSLRGNTSGGDERGESFSDSLASAFFQNAEFVELVDQSGSGLQRAQTLENVHAVTWNFHSKRTTFGNENVERRDFSLERVAEARFGFVSISELFGVDPAVSLFSSIELWRFNAAGNSVSVSRPDASAADNLGGHPIFYTLRSALLSSDTPVPPAIIGESPATLDAALLFNRQLVTGLDNVQRQEDIPRGRLRVGNLRGFSDAAGNILTFSMDDQATAEFGGDIGTGPFPVRGRGIGHAVRLTTEQPELANKRYRLAGHTLGFLPAVNRLSSFDDSILSFSADLTPTLTLVERFAEQVAGTVEVRPFSGRTLGTVTATASPLAAGPVGNAVAMTFPDPTGGAEPVKLEGFVSADEALLILRMRYGDRIGLVYGFLERVLPVN